MRAADGLRRRLDELGASPAYKNYEYVRERVLRMKDLEAPRGDEISAPSEYWREELANLEYLLDASPLIIGRLRHHCHHVTGVRVYEYRSNREEAKARFAAKLDALLQVGRRDLLVPEAPVLGGFGFEIDGALYNLDTLKCYEALIALDRAAILSEFRDARDRKVVWEIGAGWGGFAYQFKSLFPSVTYVITDFPELLLFSGVYLMTAFPEAKLRFYGDEACGDLWAGWQELDFILIPTFALPEFAPERLDATINMVSFQEMTTDQVAAYAQTAFERGCRYLYSLNRDRSPYNTQLTSVRGVLERFYWLHDVPVLPVSYTKVFDGQISALKKHARDREEEEESRDKADLDYKHLVGWRRVRP